MKCKIVQKKGNDWEVVQKKAKKHFEKKMKKTHNYFTIIILFFCVNSFSQSFTKKYFPEDSITSNRYIANNILFQFHKKEFLDHGYHPFVLDSIAEFMKQNESVVLEVGVHTDSRYSDKLSTCLTCNRAKLIVEYLINKGISSERLKAIGYNDKKLLIADEVIYQAKTKEEQELLHAKNRRVEFVII